MRLNGLGVVYGMTATLSVWKPKVEDREIELSISQVWVSSGSYKKKNLQTIEIGWQVYPQLYNNDKTRLFTFWTNDTYQTGCYNLRCPGFVQTNRNIILGGAITPISVFGGRQSELDILVWKDRKHGNWWLSLGNGDNSLVGYWPAELFTSVDPADEVSWGGEIVDTHRFGRHTKTQMGSGHYPMEGFGKASYIRNLASIDINNNLQPIPKSNTDTQISKYYKVKNLETDNEPYFYFGGTGLSTHSGVL
ncbi:unnamed protein product [Thlaspi arvense]|uniref:Neprosin PEP catalytic domain-containing protein n=1 Tax=Thlaspi arvense TaxID=13288 RepID=A0AAU9S789_THLAR|nr:unnamed protein product [Thlaspi arvense]